MRRIAQSKLECRCDVVTARVAGLAAQAQGKTSADEVDPKTTQSDAIISLGKRKNELFQKMS